MRPEVHGIPATREDVQAVVQFVADVERSQKNEMVDAFMRPFREDAVWVTGHGKLLSGREEIGAFTQRVLPGSQRDGSATYEVVRIVFIRPDIAAVNVRQLLASPESEPAGHTQGSPLYVLAKDDGEWKVAAAQNTVVLDPDTLVTAGRSGGDKP